ncbi:MAG: hypothetical protein ACOVQC_00095 [Flavobacterium sp.]
MKKAIKIFGLLLFLVTIFLYIDLCSSVVFPWQRNDAIETTLNWGGLAKIPKEAEIVNVEKEGSLFTRTFLVQFKANENDIKNWILKSKRLKKTEPRKHKNIKIYDIHPGEKESFGGKVSIENGKVTIRMSWS